MPIVVAGIRSIGDAAIIWVSGITNTDANVRPNIEPGMQLLAAQKT